MQIDAATPREYIDALPPERAKVVRKLRALVRKHLPKGYKEGAAWGMIVYEVPLKRHPETYNGKPLLYVGLAAQKRHYALYLMGLYSNPQLEKCLRAAFKQASLKPDIGKCCLRFKNLDAVPLDAVAEVIAAVPVERFIENYEAARKR